ncbi:hypothetical protein [Idiomarina sp. HP20-50]|uniref:hypothetical protein n=1 Tax=Idiomarina sp. HP20-50 TaxID=3070813 RepID=UPI00294B145B|nr:hypothetical protein [Idiomarina sp. HP20-50]MDV6316633.1 hypothetical protein [Idiomarina sp. HP20-50]
MADSLRKVLWLWGIGLLLFIVFAIAVSYFLTSYQAKKFNDTLQRQYQTLRESVPRVPELPHSRLSAAQPVNVSSLLTQAARQQKVNLHYQQDARNSEQWLVGVSGDYQSAARFIASVLQAQRNSEQSFPLTQTLKWQDTGAQTGQLSWQFLWVTAAGSKLPEHNSPAVFKTHFPQVIAEPIKCLSKPKAHSEIKISAWSSVQLLATQTSPLQKVLLKIPEQPLLTLTEREWIETPLIQLRSIHPDYATFQHWQKEAGCWSAHSLTLYLTQDTNSQ